MCATIQTLSVQKTSGTTDLNQTRTQNAANEITEIGATTGTNWADPLHDKNGNMTSVPQGDRPGGYSADEANLFVYDAWNRLIEMHEPWESGGLGVAQFRYDALNRRVRVKHHEYNSGGWEDTYDCYYDADWREVERHYLFYYDQTPVIDQQYVWGLRYIDQPILRDRNSDRDDQTGNLGFTGSGLEQRHYAMQDANFNVVALADTNGDVVERMSYSAYGAPTFYTSTFGSRTSSSYDWNVLFTGQPQDTYTGLYHYRNRDYSPMLGRFISRDPVGYYGGDDNLYRYVRNNPLVAGDPFGLDCSNLCSLTAAPKNVAVDQVSLKWAMSPVAPGRAEALQWGMNVILNISTIQTILENDPFGVAYGQLQSEIANALVAQIGQLHKNRMDTEGIAIWVHVKWECCECQSCWVFYSQNVYKPTHGWYKCPATGKDGLGVGFISTDYAGIANGTLGCVKDAKKKAKCPWVADTSF